MKLSAEQCFLSCKDAQVTMLAYSAGLSEADRDTLREQATALGGQDRAQYRALPLGTDRVALSRTLTWKGTEGAVSVHTLVFALEGLAEARLGLFPVCLTADAFLATCPYRDNTASVRTLEWAEAEEESVLSRLARVGSRARLSAMIEGAVLATREQPWTFAPPAQSQVLPWFGALIACLPPAWRADLSWSSSSPAPCAWLGSRDQEAGKAWRFTGEARPSHLSYGMVLADHILGGRFDEAKKMVASIAGPRPATIDAVSRLLDTGLPSMEEDREQSLFESARWMRKELGGTVATTQS